MVRTLHQKADDSSQQTHLLTAAASEWIVCGHVAGCQILAVATLIYHNAMPNGPVLVHIVFHVLENGLPTSAIPPPRPGALERHQNTAHRFVRNRTPSRPPRDSSYVAPPPVLAVECLQASHLSQAQKQNASAARPRSVQSGKGGCVCVCVCDERDP